MSVHQERQGLENNLCSFQVNTIFRASYFMVWLRSVVSLKIVQKFGSGPLLWDRNNASFFESFAPAETCVVIKHNVRRETQWSNNIPVRQTARDLRAEWKSYQQAKFPRIPTKASGPSQDEREWARERKGERDWRMKSTEHRRVCSEHAAGQVSIVKPHYRCNYQAKNIMWDGGVSECIQYRPPLYKVNPRVYVEVVRVTADRTAREGKRFVFPLKIMIFENNDRI